MKVTDIDVRAAPEGARLTADVVWERAPHGTDRLDYLYYGLAVDDVTTPGDALLAAVLVPAMIFGEDVCIDARVSKQLMSNAAEIVDIWTTWRRKWHGTRVAAAAVEPSTARPDEVAACFSGGVDSFYTILRPREEPITTLVTLRDFELRPWTVEQTSGHIARLARAASRLGKRHIVVDANVYRWALPYLRAARLPSVHHGAALASMILGLGKIIRRCYIAGSEPFPDRPWGSHPRVDPLWSTETLEFVHDAAELSRTVKQELVVSSDVALATLRVCSARRPSYDNCGRCDKCVSTALLLHNAGTLGRSATFGPVTPEIVRQARIGVWHHNIWKDLREQTRDPELRRAVSTALRKARARRLARPLGNALRRLGLR